MQRRKAWASPTADHRAELEARADAKLAIRVHQVPLNRLLGHEQRLRYLAVGRPARRELAHSPLRGRQGVHAGQLEPGSAAAAGAQVAP
jgi:hypothetical protein